MKRQFFAQQFLVLGLMVSLSGSLGAATINVWSNAGAVGGDGKCSIQEAVQAANTNQAVDNCPAGESSATDTIKINYIGTIVISSTLLVTEAVHIEGYGPGVTILSGNHQRQIMRIDMVDMTDDFSVESLSFIDARSNVLYHDRGGAVQLAQGRDFTFTAVTFQGNDNTVGMGTSIFAGPLTGNDNGRLFISECSFVNNTSATGSGSAIYSLYNTDLFEPRNNISPLKTISIEDCDFKDNTSNFGVAAVRTYGVKNVIVRGSLFRGNDAGGSGTLSIGGDDVHGRTLAFVDNNTFMNNAADDHNAGVSIYNADALMSQNTFYNNVSQAENGTGGALSVGGNAYAALYYNTFMENSAGRAYDSSVYVGNTSSLYMLGNIIFSASEDDSDCLIGPQAVYQSLGANIDGDGSCGGHGGDAVTSDPKLNPIGKFGGNGNTVVQYTMPPMANSVAVDFGAVNNCTAALGVNLTQDQRGKTKPVDGNGDTIVACDAGSSEYQPGDDPQLQNQLSVAVTGSGSVTIAELESSCSSQCGYKVAEGTVLTLTPNVPAGQEFLGFSGVCNGQNPCQITMNADQSVEAKFVPVQKQLTVTVIGSGSVSSIPAGISCGNSCNVNYNYNQVVSLQAQAQAGWAFSHWSGVCSGSPASCSVTMSSNKTTTAHFEEVLSEEVIFSASFEQ